MWRVIVPVALIFSLPGLLVGFKVIFLAPGMTVLATAAAIIAVQSLLGAALWSSKSRSGILIVALAIAIAILPEYSIDAFLSWLGGSPNSQGHPEYTLAPVLGGSRMLLGVAWPLLMGALLLNRRGGGGNSRGVPGFELSILLLATLYLFTIYFKGHLWLMDAPVLLMLTAFYLWKALSRKEADVGRPAEHNGTQHEDSLRPFERNRVRRFEASHTGGLPLYGALAILLFGAFVLIFVTQPFTQGLYILAGEYGVDRFTLFQGVLPFISKSPLIVLVVMLAWRNRGEFAGSILLNSHFAILALAVALVPLAGLMRGMTPGVSDVILLGDRQRMELLLTASQSLMAIVILAGPKISWKGASALAIPFAFEWLAHGLLTPEADLAMVQGTFVVIYLLAAAALLLTDRSRMTVLTGAVVPEVRVRSRRPVSEHEASLTATGVRHAAVTADSELVTSVGSSPVGRTAQESESASP
ncbi:MAG: hypothetical protein IH861_02815 [Chloroflexi bacterium]|nr:hypothetical protein [Chloroflexota bacterium]